ncbi:hypothetical protein E2C01_075054 [Portunus trituberculatus]|uniref:Uncharacterized protein n=1 Tax=Portunus trituberculatus TaxID=210409 RepID=A0A5B7IIW4_PORTR|nr:hypothetical protein [Portunus trituberculatus]
MVPFPTQPHPSSYPSPSITPTSTAHSATRDYHMHASLPATPSAPSRPSLGPHNPGVEYGGER